MAETNGEKTEAPTPRKRAEALEEGRVAKSLDLSSALILLGAVILLGWFGGLAAQALRDLLAVYLSPAQLHNFEPPSIVELFMTLTAHVLSAIWPLMLGICVLAVLASVLQTGLIFSTKKLEPKASMLNPIEGVKRLFSKGQAFVNLLQNIVKLVIVALVTYSAVHGKLDAIVAAAALETMQIVDLATGIIYDIAIRLAIVLLLLAVIDYAYQRWRFEQELKMTKQEVKDEMKRMDGDPQIKLRRRQIQMQRAVQRVRNDVPTADVIVTNPTHFAVALKYDDATMKAPKVVAKGADFLAFRIREIAVENGIPIVSRPPLARALYKDCRIGDEIPEGFYNAVAEILAYVYELTRKGVRS